MFDLSSYDDELVDAALDGLGPIVALTPANAPPLTDRTPIFFRNDREPNGGSYIDFGALMVQDRKTVEWNAFRAEYVGAYPY